MSGYNTDEVLASVWNDLASEIRSSSDSEFEPDSDSGSERDDPVYDSSENIESEDTDSSNGSQQSEDEVTNNDANPQQQRKRPRQQQQQQQPALVWHTGDKWHWQSRG